MNSKAPKKQSTTTKANKLEEKNLNKYKKQSLLSQDDEEDDFEEPALEEDKFDLDDLEDFDDDEDEDDDF